MFERLLIVLLLGAMLIAGWQIVRIWQRRQFRRVTAAPLAPEVAALLEPGRPAVISFSTPGCAECRTLQRPALEQLRDRFTHSVTISHLSAPNHPALVKHFGILSVPATVVLAPSGIVRHINLRYTDVERLQAQVQDALV